MRSGFISESERARTLELAPGFGLGLFLASQSLVEPSVAAWTAPSTLETAITDGVLHAAGIGVKWSHGGNMLTVIDEVEIWCRVALHLWDWWKAGAR